MSSSLDHLEGDDGSSPWGDERSSSTPPVAFPDSSNDDNGFKDSISTSSPSKPQEISKPASTSKPTPSRRLPRRGARNTVRVEAIDDAEGPLGPLGDNSSELSTPGPPGAAMETPPLPPVKESPLSRAGAALSPGAARSSDGNFLGDRTEVQPIGVIDEPRPIGSPSDGRNGQGGQPSQPQVPQKPVFEVSVGDPHKVGDLTSAHTVYQVRTKTTSTAFRQPEFEVSRRYRDFLWLYDVLNSNNPGVVVPPPPEKQAVGRFDENFVESRRAALERMVNKICQHPILLQDNDLKLFLESESLSNDIKHRVHNTPLPTENKGLFSFGISSAPKFTETDDFFHDRKLYLDALETQLKNLLKAVDGVVKQRKDLAEAAADFSSSLHALSTVELSKSLSSPLDHLSSLQLRIQELHERQAAQDILTIGITIDEYIRIIGSIKLAFQQRQKAFQNCHAAEQELIKRKQTFDKLQRQGKTQQDRLTQLNAEVGDSERKVHQARVLFDDMGRLVRSELERFEREKVEDFKSAVETWLESSVEAQKELIELWESYLLQLDREEEELAAEEAARHAASGKKAQVQPQQVVAPPVEAPDSPPPQEDGAQDSLVDKRLEEEQEEEGSGDGQDHSNAVRA